jgi:small-conductance mechanosensitive channel
VAAAAAQPRVLSELAPAAMLSEFAPDGLELTLAYWISDPENGINNVRSDINLAIWRAFQASAIKVSQAPRMVRVVNDTPLPVNSAPCEKI